MVTTIEKLHQLLELADDFGGKQFREDVRGLVIALCERPHCTAAWPPIYRDYVHATPAMPVPLSLDWLYQDLNEFEQYYGRRPDALKVSERQQRMIGSLLYHWPAWAPPTHFDGIPLIVLPHGGGITG